LEFLQRVGQPGSEAPDIILLDVNMPKMNGVEFLTAIRQSDKWKDTKVFIITTSEEKEDKEATRKLGVSGYIVKPLTSVSHSPVDRANKCRKPNHFLETEVSHLTESMH
jgi:CheY-like chemotaxis protein